jgi:hypothetical protein
MRLSVFLLMLPVATSVAVARASGPQSATADAMFRYAKEAMARGDLATACAQFAESERLEPATGTLLNLADCEERSGKLSAALGHYRMARDGMPPSDFRVSFANDKIASVTKRVPYLTLRLHAPTVPGTRVMIDEVELSPASLGVPIPVDPGRHICAVIVPGRADARREVSLQEAQAQTLELVPGPVGEARRSVFASAPSSEAGDSSTTSRTLGFVSGAVGLVGLGAGTVAGVITITAANTYKNECRNGYCSPQGRDAAATGQVMQWVSPIGFAVGAVGIGLASYFLFFQPKATRSTATVTPAIGPTTMGLSLSDTFF